MQNIYFELVANDGESMGVEVGSDKHVDMLRRLAHQETGVRLCKYRGNNLHDARLCGEWERDNSFVGYTQL